MRSCAQPGCMARPYSGGLCSFHALQCYYRKRIDARKDAEAARDPAPAPAASAPAKESVEAEEVVVTAGAGPRRR